MTSIDTATAAPPAMELDVSFQSKSTITPEKTTRKETKVMEISSTNEFASLLTASRILIALFSAEAWCEPCQDFLPLFNLTSLSHPTIPFCLVDADRCPDLQRNLKITALPTVQVFIDGVSVQELKGVDDPAFLRMLNYCLSTPHPNEKTIWWGFNCDFCQANEYSGNNTFCENCSDTFCWDCISSKVELGKCRKSVSSGEGVKGQEDVIGDAEHTLTTSSSTSSRADSVISSMKKGVIAYLVKKGYTNQERNEEMWEEYKPDLTTILDIYEAEKEKKKEEEEETAKHVLTTASSNDGTVIPITDKEDSPSSSDHPLVIRKEETASTAASTETKTQKKKMEVVCDDNVCVLISKLEA